jgi:hypothetical protein
MSNEAMTQSGSSKTYYTTDEDKNLWNPEQSFIVKDDSVIVNASNYTIDHMMGKVTFASGYTVTNPSNVEVTGYYLAKLSFAAARTFSLNIVRNAQDDTVLGDDAVSRLAGLLDVTGTVERLTYLVDYDAGAGTSELYADLAAGAIVVIELKPDTNSDIAYRVTARLFGDELQSSVDGLVTSSLAFEGVLASATQSLPVSYGDPTA